MQKLADLPLPENERRASEAAARLLHEACPVEQVVLFGSQARAGGDEEWDIGLLVLTARKLPWRAVDAITCGFSETGRLRQIVC